MAKRSEGVLFRKSMRGFKKEDVQNYILELNRQFEEHEKELLEEKAQDIEAKERAIAALESEKASLSSELADLRDTLAHTEAALAAAQEKLTGAENMIALQNDRLATLSEEAETLRAENENAKLGEGEIVVMREEYESLTEKATVADQITHQLGDIMLGATLRAEEIVKKAEEDAREVSETAHAKADAILADARKTADSLLAEISGTTSSISERAIRDMRQNVTSMHSSVATVMQEMSASENKLKSNFETYIGDLLKSISDTFKKFSDK